MNNIGQEIKFSLNLAIIMEAVVILVTNVNNPLNVLLFHFSFEKDNLQFKTLMTFSIFNSRYFEIKIKNLPYANIF